MLTHKNGSFWRSKIIGVGITLATFAFIDFLAASCSKNTGGGTTSGFTTSTSSSAATTSTSSTTTTSSTSTTGGTANAFELDVITNLDSQPTTFVSREQFFVPASTPVGTILPVTVQIPEGDLHYSALNIKLNMLNPGTCEILYFRPYYYRASTSASWSATWMAPGTTADCSGASTPPGANCYSGVAVDMVPSFPTFAYIYLTPDPNGNISGSWLARSAEAAGRYRSNRWTNNTLLPASRPNAAATASPGDSYVGALNEPGYGMVNQFVDYTVECRDKWADLNWQINLTIDDIYTGGPVCNANLNTCNEFPNWNSTQPYDMQ